jgi:nucleoside-diphosphate-sugar epimerase
MDVLVTGGAGFVGSHLVQGLARAGHRVRVLDDFSTGRRENLQHLESGIELLEGSILDSVILGRAVDGVEVVFHEAAIPSVPRSVRNPSMSNEVNVTGTLNVLLAARDAGVRRLIYAASSSAYGAATGGARVESMPPRPLSPYAVAKLAGEHYCQVFAQIYGLETVCLRYFNVFGPRQDPASEYAAVIPKFITALLARRPLTIYGDGTQSRDFTYVENVIAANLLAMTAPEASGHVFNIGCGQQTSLNELVRQLGRIAQAEPAISYCPPQSGDVPYSLADITKARTLLGYEPIVSLATGLRQTWDYFEAQQRKSSEHQQGSAIGATAV